MKFHPLNDDVIITSGSRSTVKLFNIVTGKQLSSICIDLSDPLPTTFCQSAISNDSAVLAVAGHQTIALFNISYSKAVPYGSIFLEQFGQNDPYFAAVQRDMPSYHVSDLGYRQTPTQQPALCNARFEPYKDRVPQSYFFPCILNIINFRHERTLQQMLHDCPFWARVENEFPGVNQRWFSYQTTISFNSKQVVSGKSGLLHEKQVVIEPPPPPIPSPPVLPNVNVIPPINPVSDVLVLPDDDFTDPEMESDEGEFIPDDEEADVIDDVIDEEEITDDDGDDDLSYNPSASVHIPLVINQVETSMSSTRHQSRQPRRSRRTGELDPVGVLPAKRRRRQLMDSMDGSYSIINQSYRHEEVDYEHPDFDKVVTDDVSDNQSDSSDEEFMEEIIRLQHQAHDVKEQKEQKRPRNVKSKPVELPSLESLAITSRDGWSNMSDCGFVPQPGDDVVYLPFLHSLTIESCRIMLLSGYYHRMSTKGDVTRQELLEYFSFLCTVLPDLEIDHQTNPMVKGQIQTIDFEIVTGDYPESCLPLISSCIHFSSTDAPLKEITDCPPSPTSLPSLSYSSTRELRLRRRSRYTCPSLNTRRKSNQAADPKDRLKPKLTPFARTVDFQIESVLAPPFPYILPAKVLDLNNDFSFKEGDFVYVNRHTGYPQIQGQDIFEFRKYLSDSDAPLPSYISSLSSSEHSVPLCYWLGSSLMSSTGSKLGRRREAKIIENSSNNSTLSDAFNTICIEFVSAKSDHTQLIVSPWDIIPHDSPAKKITTPCDVSPSYLSMEYCELAFNIISRLIEDSDEFNMFQETPTDRIAPGYSAIVPMPMSISTIICKLQCKAYRHAFALKTDVELILRNSELYNGLNDTEIVPSARLLVENLISELFK
ncbi:hypothetical protein GEMRC1_009151 [Eukaryota sp. GEM-RC1]